MEIPGGIEESYPASRRMISYPFSLGDSRRAPLSWAQQFMWRAVSLPGNGARLDLVIYVEVPRDMTVASASKSICRLIKQNPTLRTQIVTDANGQDYQRVVGHGVISVYVSDGGSPLAYSEVVDRLPPTSGSSPVQSIIICVRGSVRSVAVRINHVAVDVWGFRLLKEELESELSRKVTSEPDFGISIRRSSVDRTAFESSEIGKAVAKRSQEYAREQLTSCPQTMFPYRPARPERPRYWNIEFRSAALHMAISQLADRYGLMMSVPIIGGFAAIMTTRASLPSALIYVGSGNRFERAWQEFTGPLFQEAVIGIRIPESDCLSLLSSLNSRITGMYICGQHDHTARYELIKQLEHARGICLDKMTTSLMLNIVNSRHRADAKAEPSSGPISHAASTSRLSRKPQREVDNCAFSLSISILNSEVLVNLYLDTKLVSIPESEAIIRGVERLLCELCERNVPIGEIASLCPGIGTSNDAGVIIDGSRIDLDDCCAVLESHPAVHESCTRKGVDGKGTKLSAYVHVNDAG